MYTKLKVDASKTIQAGCQMYTTRKQYQIAVDASKKIQAGCRIYTTRKRYRIAVEASKKIQACCRMYTARKQLQVAVQAATKIQAVWRTMQARKMAVSSYRILKLLFLSVSLVVLLLDHLHQNMQQLPKYMSSSRLHRMRRRQK